MRGHRRDANLKHLDHLVAAYKDGGRLVVEVDISMVMSNFLAR
jgi:hypothetical protein